MSGTTAVSVHIPNDIPGTIPAGGRNVTLTRLAGALRAQGLGGQALLDVLERENGIRCRPPLSTGEVLSIARSVERYEPGEPRDPYIARPRGAQSGGSAPVRPKSREFPTVEPPGDAWQERARAFAEYAEGQLWQDPEALAYLRGRGLRDDTIRAAALGYNPKALWDDPARWGLSGKKIWLPRGWTVPNVSDGAWWGVNIRRPAADLPPDGRGKYIGPRGGRKRLYGLPWLGHHSDLVLVEGEFDALLLGQEAGAILSAVALGGSENRPDTGSLGVLAGYRRWWVCTDQDDAGREALADLLAMTERARPVELGREDAKDVTDLWHAGVDLATWAVNIVGPEDPTDYQRWAMVYMAATEEEPDEDAPDARVWRALLERFNRTGREHGFIGQQEAGA